MAGDGNGKTLFGATIFLLVFFGLCYFAYVCKADHDAAELGKKNAELKKKLEDATRANSKLFTDSAARGQARLGVIKKTLLIVIPDKAELIENAFKESEPKEEAKEKAKEDEPNG